LGLIPAALAIAALRAISLRTYSSNSPGFIASMGSPPIAATACSSYQLYGLRAQFLDDIKGSDGTNIPT
jgi:hypothetical protein